MFLTNVYVSHSAILYLSCPRRDQLIGVLLITFLQLRGKLGVVHSISDNGDMKIKYGDNLCTMNPEALVKVRTYV